MKRSIAILVGSLRSAPTHSGGVVGPMNRRRLRHLGAISGWAASILLACGGQVPRERVQGPTAEMGGSGDAVIGARAELRDAAGRVLGTLELRDAGDGILLTGSLRGLAPGSHGLHLHETGRCEPSFDSAGEHWNPTRRQHGLQNPNGPHLGDLAGVEASADSAAEVLTTTPGGLLRGPNGLLDGDGAAVVVHARPDDGRTDPSGNSGDRIACGVVVKAD